MEYKITAIDQEKNIVTLDYTYGDKTVTKRMQVHNSDTKETIVAEVDEWASNFARIKAEENALQQDVSSLIGKKQTVEAEPVTEV